MNRGISTVLDVGIAMVLIGASVAVIAGVPAPDEGASRVPEVGETAIGGSTLTVRYDRPDGPDAVVTGTATGLIRDAALGRGTPAGAAYADAVERAVTERIEETSARVQIVGACSTGDVDPDDVDGERRVVAGPAPPGDRPVDATLYRWNATRRSDGTACSPVVVVRRWSA
ncbi:MAG: hypothetical protein ABEJ77_03605 [Halanaeroarchaeum sp.]